MNKSRIVELRQAMGWTQERLAEASGVGLRTVQRLEAGSDASLETLSLVADALNVTVRDLFSAIEDESLSSRVDSLQDRVDAQQAARDRISGAWWWLYFGIGVVITMLCFTFPQGTAVFFAYWSGGLLILIAARRLYLEPRLDEKYPLSRRSRSHNGRAHRKPQQAAQSKPVTRSQP